VTKAPKVVFVASQQPENLGVNYLSSMLISKGFDIEKLDFELGNEEILRLLREADPILVGFSLIFQYYLPLIGDLARFLRARGVKCHLTVGGHYPSLRYEDTLNHIPELDSVVRFEGELTICELAEKLRAGEEWRDIKGIAYRKNRKPFSNDLRPLIADLDTLPFPNRNSKEGITCMKKRSAYILAKRGCLKDCSFCSIRKFYGKPPGGLRRTRTVQNVVKEMQELYEKNQTCIFLFQDDDFLSPGNLGNAWALDFVAELEHQDLADKFLWKISCRPDEIKKEVFEKLKKAGLFLVYLGIESGNPTGLRVLNKHLTVEQNVSAVEALKQIGLLYDFGFMLTDPSSTFETVRENIAFLRKICADGSSPVGFCKMIPYAETDIEQTLAREGRLKGSVLAPDYDFFDHELDRYVEFLHKTFREWMFTETGLRARLQWHRFEVAVLEKFYNMARGIHEYKNILKRIVASSNILFLKIAEEAIPIFEQGRQKDCSKLKEMAVFLSSETEKIELRLRTEMSKFNEKQAK
jgi:anaerobic magnesium-protoporphyrin IX monomethyl ester cyclase